MSIETVYKRVLKQYTNEYRNSIERVYKEVYKQYIS